MCTWPVDTHKSLVCLSSTDKWWERKNKSELDKSTNTGDPFNRRWETDKCIVPTTWQVSTRCGRGFATAGVASPPQTGLENLGIWGGGTRAKLRLTLLNVYQLVQSLYVTRSAQTPIEQCCPATPCVLWAASSRGCWERPGWGFSRQHCVRDSPVDVWSVTSMSSIRFRDMMLNPLMP